MDYNTNNSNGYGYGQPDPGYSRRRYSADGEGFAHAAFIMGILAFLTFRISFFPTMLAAVALILAILSKGYNRKLSTKARSAALLAAIAIVLNVAFSIYHIHTLLHNEQFFYQFEQMYEQLYGVPADSAFDLEGGEFL